MFSEDNLKQKNDQDLRKICKELNCAQYGDKATLIKQILETITTCDDQVEGTRLQQDEETSAYRVAEEEEDWGFQQQAQG